MHWIWVLIVGGLIGLAAGALTRRGGSMGVISNIVAGLVGSSIGEAVLGAWGPQVAGMAIIPSIIGAVILVMIVSLIFGVKAERQTNIKSSGQKLIAAFYVSSFHTFQTDDNLELTFLLLIMFHHFHKQYLKYQCVH